METETRWNGGAEMTTTQKWIDSPTCETCRWWRVWGEVSSGTCHRFPPTPDFHRHNDGQFSVTVRLDWCGEHTKVETT